MRRTSPTALGERAPTRASVRRACGHGHRARAPRCRVHAASASPLDGGRASEGAAHSPAQEAPRLRHLRSVAAALSAGRGSAASVVAAAALLRALPPHDASCPHDEAVDNLAKAIFVALERSLGGSYASTPPDEAVVVATRAALSSSPAFDPDGAADDHTVSALRERASPSTLGAVAEVRLARVRPGADSAEAARAAALSAALAALRASPAAPPADGGAGSGGGEWGGAGALAARLAAAHAAASCRASLLARLSSGLRNDAPDSALAARRAARATEMELDVCSANIGASIATLAEAAACRAEAAPSPAAAAAGAPWCPLITGAVLSLRALGLSGFRVRTVAECESALVSVRDLPGTGGTGAALALRDVASARALRAAAGGAARLGCAHRDAAAAAVVQGGEANGSEEHVVSGEEGGTHGDALVRIAAALVRCLDAAGAAAGGEGPGR